MRDSRCTIQSKTKDYKETDSGDGKSWEEEEQDIQMIQNQDASVSTPQGKCNS